MVKRLIGFPIFLLLLSPLLAIEKEPLAEYKSRRDRLAERIKGNLLVLRAAPGVDLMEYVQEDNFYYLTGFDEPNAILLLDATSTPPEEYLFLPERRPSQERWTGPKLGPGPDGVQATGFRNVLPVSQFDATLLRLKARAKGELGLSAVREILADLRQVKSATELGLLEKAIQITLHGHEAASRTIKPGAWEYEVEAALEYEFRRRGAERPAFPSIVGSGPFSTILHYDKSTRRMEAGDLVVVDVGAEYGGYAADVTRTYPVSGKFSARQREIYQIVLDAQKAAMARIKPGATMAEIHRAAREHIRSKGYGENFPHGTSHHIGLHVHDVGSDRPLEPGMVFTVEPGIYLPEEKLGVRIEDDVVVTETGYRILSNFPKEISEIEALFQKR